MLKRIIAALGFLVGLTSCTTPPVVTAPPSVSVPRTDVDDRIAAANAVYLARVERSGGLAHYIVAEVWRHDPVLGPAPAIGSEWVTMFPKKESAELGDAVVIFIDPGQVSASNAGRAGRTTQITPVANGRLVVSRTAVAGLRARVVAGTPASRLTASREPTLDEVVLRARAIYLARIERSGGLLHYIVAEIWRSDPSRGPPPAIGSEVLDSRPKKDIPTMNYGDFVVVAIFSPPLERGNGRGIPYAATAVIHGNVTSFQRSLAEVRALVGSSQPPANLGDIETGSEPLKEKTE
jgi:hypothetical protein